MCCTGKTNFLEFVYNFYQLILIIQVRRRIQCDNPNLHDTLLLALLHYSGYLCRCDPFYRINYGIDAVSLSSLLPVFVNRFVLCNWATSKGFGMFNLKVVLHFK